MKRFLMHSLPLGLLVLVAWKVAPAQRDLSKVEIKATHLAGSVHMLEGAGGNIGVSAGADGILIVDDQFAPLAEKIRAALGKIQPGEPRWVLNTHFHFDHTGSNAAFGKVATIVAHENVRRRLSAKSEVLGQVSEAAPREALPVVTFDDDLSIHVNGEDIDVIHLPHGHTDGDSVVFFRTANVVHMGDHCFTGRFPFIDLGSGGDVEGYTANVAKVLGMIQADTQVIPGHGSLSTKKDLESFHAMLVETTAIVHKRIDAKQTLADAQAAGLPETWKSWGTGFIPTDKWIEIVYKSLEARRAK